MRRTGTLVAMCAVVLALVGEPASSATPAGTFRCRLSATKLGHDIQVTFRLRSSAAAETWRVRMWNGNRKFADRTHVTNPSGRLRVVGVTRNRPGRDVLAAIARNPDTGLRCRVELTI